MTHSKNQIPLIYLLVNCVSAESACEMLTLRNVYTFHFLDFLIIGLCNFSANCWFDIITVLIGPPEVLTADLSAHVAEF